jgi:hypothetical protein
MRWDDANWQAWRPEEAVARLRALDVPWYVAAGWAIDLFVGYERREHEDLEIAVPEARFGDVARALGDLDWYTAGDGEVASLVEAPERLAETHQTWGLDRTAYVWRIDVFREPGDGDMWICRRDDRIRLPYRELIERTPDGVPYVRPEVALLFKANAARPKDESDLEDVLPLLTDVRRSLLHEWLGLVHPSHPWLARLD